MLAKHDALKHSKELRAKKVYLDADLTPAQQATRRVKADRYRQLRDEGKKPFWRADRHFFYVHDKVQGGTCASGSPTQRPCAYWESTWQASNSAGPLGTRTPTEQCCASLGRD